MIYAGLNQWVNVILSTGIYVYAGCYYPVLNSTNKGVWISSNYGANWTQTSLNYVNIHALAINGNNLFAGTDVYGVYLSTNGGSTWTQTSLNFTTIWSLAINGNYIFAGGGGSGIYLSTNNGTNWVQTSLNNATPRAILIYGNTVIEGGGGPSCIYVSTDYGTTWTPRNEGMSYYVRSLCILNNYIFAGTDGMGVFRRPLNELVGVKTTSEEVPAIYELKQNYPNPFNTTTNFGFRLPTAGRDANFGFIQLIIYDALGREITKLVNEKLKSGSYEINCNATNFTSGVYFYQLIADNKLIDTKKMILVK